MVNACRKLSISKKPYIALREITQRFIPLLADIPRLSRSLELATMNTQRTHRMKAKPPVPRPETKGEENDPSARVIFRNWLNFTDPTLRVQPRTAPHIVVL